MARKKVKVRKPKKKKKPVAFLIDPILNELAWEISRVVTARRPNPEYINIKSFCPTCKMYFCLGFDGVLVWCKECFYHPCHKELESRRICKPCSGSN